MSLAKDLWKEKQMYFEVTSIPRLNQRYNLKYQPLFFLNSYLFIYFWLSLCGCMGFSLVVVSGSYSPAVVCRLLIEEASLAAAQGLGVQAPAGAGPGL